MRTFENKTLKIKKQIFKQDSVKNTIIEVQAEIDTDYFEIIKDILKNPPKTGWGKADMEKLKTRLELIDKLKNKDQILKLEEDEYKEINSALDNWFFSFTSHEVLDFQEYILKRPKEELK